MTISAAFTFSGVATPLAKKSVAAATSFTATIDDLSGVQSVEWAIVGTDGATAIGDYTAVASGPKGSVYTITSLTQFTGGLVQATVRNGDFVDVQRALFYVPSTAGGFEPLIFNEWFEGDSAAAYVRKMNAATLAFSAAVGFDPQAATVDIATTGGGGVTTIASRSGEQLDLGGAGTGLAVTAIGTATLDFDECETTGSTSLYWATPLAQFVVDAEQHVCDSFEVAAQATATINTCPILQGRIVRAIATGNVASLTSVTTMDGLTLADGDLVLLPLQTTTTENGVYRYTLSTTTLARDESFNALAHYILGTTVRAYAGTANAGKAYQLQALSSSLPATWVDVSGSGSAGASVTDSTGTFGFLGSAGALSGTGLASAAISATGAATFLGGAGFGLTVGANGDIDLTSESAEQIVITSGDAVSITATTSIIDAIGSSACTTTVSGANRSEVTTDAAGSTALTSLYDDAASSHTYVGTLTIASGAMSLRSTGDIDLRPTGATTDSLKVAIVSTETKLTTPGSQNLRVIAGATAIFEGTGRTILNASSATKLDAIAGGVTELTASTTLGLYASGRLVNMGTAAATSRISSHFPADTATTDATQTTLASFTPTARPSTYQFVVHAFDGSLNVASWTLEATAILRGGAAENVGTFPAAAAPTASDAALAATLITIDKSGTTVRVRGTGIIATNLTWSVTVVEKK